MHGIIYGLTFIFISPCEVPSLLKPFYGSVTIVPGVNRASGLAIWGLAISNATAVVLRAAAMDAMVSLQQWHSAEIQRLTQVSVIMPVDSRLWWRIEFNMLSGRQPALSRLPASRIWHGMMIGHWQRIQCPPGSCGHSAPCGHWRCCGSGRRGRCQESGSSRRFGVCRCGRLTGCRRWRLAGCARRCRCRSLCWCRRRRSR